MRSLHTPLLIAVLLGFPLLLSAQTVSFTDVTTSAGLNIARTVPNPGERIAMTGGAAARDVNGDGWVDLILTRIDANPILYTNLGNGTFTDGTVASGIVMTDGSNGAAWGDVDNDGDPDLYLTRADFTPVATGSHQLFINQGAGTFLEEGITRGVSAGAATEEFYGTSACFGDYNRDGWLDLHVNEWGNGVFRGVSETHVKLFRNIGNTNPGAFENKTAAAGVSIDDSVGSGCLFTTMFGAFAFSSRFSDLDLDGDQDLIIAGDFNTSRLFRNNGDETFTDITTSAGVGTDENGMGLTVGDYNGDGRPDIFITSIFHTDPECTGHNESGNYGVTGNRLYRNEGSLVFSDQTNSGVRNGWWGWGASFLDMDNDGDLDLAMTNGFVATLFPDFATDPTKIFENDGSGNFTDVSASVGVTDNASGKGLLTFDYDKDGDLDLLIVNSVGLPILYRNDGGNTQSWLTIELEGTESNRDAIGARVIVDGNGTVPTQYREVDGGSNYLSQNDVVVHVGLGNSTLVDKLRIEWPSGNVQELTDLAVNQRLNIVEQSTGSSLHFTEQPGAILDWTSSWILHSSHDLQFWTPLPAAEPPYPLDTNVDPQFWKLAP